jgi:transcriptional regulator with PAS, ATPase and Fis domain
LEEYDVSDRPRLLRIEIVLKLYVLSLVLVGCLFLEFLGVSGLFRFPFDAMGISLCVFVMLNLIYLYFLKKAIRLSFLYVILGVTDIVFFTLIIHFLGGADSPVLSLLYMFPIPFFSILISPWAGYLMAMGSCMAFTVLCGLEFSGIVDAYGEVPLSLEQLGVILFFLFFCFFSIAFYMGYFAQVLRRHQRALWQANAKIAQQNYTLEERISRRTRELEKAQEKLKEYSAHLEKAYNEKSMQLEEVQRTLEKSLGELKLKYNYENIVGRTRLMEEVFQLMDKVTDFNVPVLVQGESGTGKELVAKAIHYNGPRREKPFIIQNCSAITDTLLESELFGHVKGSFTGAYQDRKGLFEEANTGTVFLDEVGDMSPAMQAKLLRVIQDGEVRPVGGMKVVRVDVRIISATNVNLKESVLQGRFREDLFYRLNGVTIRIPPLRERREDILLLAEHFLDAFSVETGMEPKSLSNDSKKLIFSYAWPGNVRELENTMKNAFVISQGKEIKIEDFRYKTELFGGMAGQNKVWSDAALTDEFTAETEDQEEEKKVPSGGTDLKKEKERKSLKETEKEAIVHALERSGGKRKEAAEMLDVPIRTLYEKIRRYGLK